MRPVLWTVTRERVEAKRHDVLWALTVGGPRSGGWMTTGEVHGAMGGRSDWKVYASWLDALVGRGWLERRGRRRQYRLTDAGRAELERLG